ncbi:MAG TPA: diacylglycerol kinase family protein [Anaeromyxobacteraceae bacterium]|nr:diacylglycerol kinase family protein [Anaeromyxobacteraceae bacterium]
MTTEAAFRWSRSEASRARGYAVLLNANAKLVNARVRQALGRLVAPDDLFFSRSAQDAVAIADTVVTRGYRTVFTGGGDGTFVGWVNRICDRAAVRDARIPRFGLLALGTGNAVAEMVGARPDHHFEDLADYASGRARSRWLNLLTCEGRRTPFAGVGIDAAVLNDYCWLMRRLAERGLGRLASGIPGYALSIALRSMPRHLIERRPRYCEIVNTGRPAYRLDASGHQSGPAIGTGELLYAGPCRMAAASTVPYYGFGLKAFPFAESRRGMLQLRVATRLPVASLLLNLPLVWSGEWSHPDVFDFHVEKVTVRFERPMPLQIGGDAEGWREEVAFAIAPEPVELVDFSGCPGRPRRELLN